MQTIIAATPEGVRLELKVWGNPDSQHCPGELVMTGADGYVSAMSLFGPSAVKDMVAILDTMNQTSKKLDRILEALEGLKP